MTAAEFVALDPAEPKNHRGFRSPGLSCLKSIYLYFSGLWLGDGTRCNATISNNHQVEIKDFLVQHAAELGLHLNPPDNLDKVQIGNEHPKYELYTELCLLINKNYDEVSAGGPMAVSDNSTIRAVKKALKKAAIARYNGENLQNGRHWQELLPSSAEMMV
ncbi:hypothetical protein HYE67_010374 [Fusarium culmorum]|uniref:Uncharacterized protein n=1 Tax=Fusarium culmorum TaxID=5516 RepID=A0A2T4H4Y3_FUSCU|nr:hypothetical protein FCULG_00011403 [Fusarium culmorum]QPC68143.1 hypothetical protein HYE67_010374 [Fusarium culmorum]